MINPLGREDTKDRRTTWDRAVAIHAAECPGSRPLHQTDEAHRHRHVMDAIARLRLELG